MDSFTIDRRPVPQSDTTRRVVDYYIDAADRCVGQRIDAVIADLKHNRVPDDKVDALACAVADNLYAAGSSEIWVWPRKHLR